MPANKDLLGNIAGGVILGVFALIAIGLIRVGLRDLILFRKRKPFLIKLPGRITEIVTERFSRGGTTGSRTDTGKIVKYIPFVIFTKPDGTTKRFRSEICEIYELRRNNGGMLREAPECKWHEGEEVEVTYDPDGILKPYIGGGMGGSGIGWAMIAAGLFTLLVCVGMGFVFAHKMRG